MKPRSKALHDYLFSLGVLNGAPEEIDAAKRSYRRLYKKRWKQAKKPRKEIRIGFTLRQFEAIKQTARQNEMKPTAYAHTAILYAAESRQVIPAIDRLLKVLQLISMAAIESEKHFEPGHGIATLLAEAESMLLQYLDIV